MKLTKTFKAFFKSEKASGVVLILCTVVSMLLANTVGRSYADFWHGYAGPLSIEHWVNDALMAVFFLLIGLELKRELISGELSSFKTAGLPVIAAVGGVIVPAAIHLSLNYGTPTRGGIGIPMATDIAFSLGLLALVGSRVPSSLKVFLVAFAVMDDLIAIVVIALFYTAELSVAYLLGAIAVWGVLAVLNRYFRIMSLAVYIAGGVVMWVLMYRSGVHATIAGVLLALAIPYSAKDDDKRSPSYKLEHALHRPVAFLILPIFALANTAIMLGGNFGGSLSTPNSMGIIIGLIAGKPVGIMLASFSAVALGLCALPHDLSWKHVAGAGMLGGIGFTMSIFITNLAFGGDAALINSSKIAVLGASLAAGIFGYVWLALAAARDPRG